MLAVDLSRQQGAFKVDVAFSAEGAGITALFGRSGAGKTSIINMVAGMTRPDRGRIQVGDRVLYDSSRKIDLPPDKRRIGYIFQDSRLFPHLSVRSNLTYGMKLVPTAERYVQFDDVVGLLGIEHLLDRRPARLSGGEKQRIAIGRALLTSPRLLCMDEPLASLDGPRKQELMPFIARLPRQFGIPILYVSHGMDEILRLADSMVLLDAGSVAATGTVEEVMSRLDLRPLTGRYEAGAVLPTVVEDHDDIYGFTNLRFPGGILKVGRLPVEPGTPIRVRIRARDVMLARSLPQGLSVQNIFRGVITGMAEVENFLVDVGLDIGSPLRAQITTRARADLDLEPGQEVYALVKSVAIARGSIAEKGAAR